LVVEYPSQSKKSNLRKDLKVRQLLNSSGRSLSLIKPVPRLITISYCSELCSTNVHKATNILSRTTQALMSYIRIIRHQPVPVGKFRTTGDYFDLSQFEENYSFEKDQTYDIIHK